MSQVELAKRLGVTKQSVSNWENDNIQPSIEMLVKLAAIFSVSTDYMLGLESGEYLDVSGLPREVIAHIRQLVDDLRAK
nr:helix-turn-helix transcriptional regulator [uncultured Oscillibacter sp.]